MAMEFNFILPKNFKSQTIECLLEKTWLVPRKQRHFLRMKKNIWLNHNNQLTWKEQVRATDTINLIFDEEDFPTHHQLSAGNPHLVDVIYQDEHLIIVNKPEGMKTHPNNENEVTLQNHVATAIKQPVYVVHRLDKDTSGLVLFAKNHFVLPILNQMLSQKLIQRQYLALVENHFNQKNITINQPIARDRHDKTKRMTTSTGQSALTHIKVLEEKNSSQSLSLVQCNLETGRTHQIRVHLSWSGHPIIGDPLYNSHSSANQRLMLHAEKINFIHPFTNKEIHLSASSQSFTDGCK